MDTRIYLNEKTSIDLPALLDTRLLIQANSGGGKSWLLRRILEQSHGKVQHIIIDLEGEFATLREKLDYVLAGRDGDTPADPKSAALLARKLLELNVSAILDLYELHYQDRKHFVRLFLESMINAPKDLWHPCLVVREGHGTQAPGSRRILCLWTGHLTGSDRSENWRCPYYPPESWVQNSDCHAHSFTLDRHHHSRTSSLRTPG